MRKFLRRARSVVRFCFYFIFYGIATLFTLAILGYFFYVWVWPVLAFFGTLFGLIAVVLGFFALSLWIGFAIFL